MEFAPFDKAVLIQLGKLEVCWIFLWVTLVDEVYEGILWTKLSTLLYVVKLGG